MQAIKKFLKYHCSTEALYVSIVIIIVKDGLIRSNMSYFSFMH
jgi:hypothetical protein